MQIETNSYPKEDGDGISVISVEKIVHRKLQQKNYNNINKDYRDTIGVWRKNLKESE